MSTRRLLMAVAAMGMVAGSVHAAIGTLTLKVDPAGTFELLASVSQGDNKGILGYGAAIRNVDIATSIDPLTQAEILDNPMHVSPVALANNTFQRFGFILQRGFIVDRDTSDNPVVVRLGAAQDNATPSPHIVFGFGQRNGTMQQDSIDTLGGGINPLFPGTLQPEYEADLLLAAGTWDPSGPLPEFDTTIAEDNFINVFNNNAGPGKVTGRDNTEAAQIQLVVDASMIPEPGTMALLALGAVSMLRRRRQTA